MTPFAISQSSQHVLARSEEPAFLAGVCKQRAKSGCLQESFGHIKAGDESRMEEEKKI